jgi:MFS transporter, PAT family, beta-lactamase induction signal transducer AmpG
VAVDPEPDNVFRPPREDAVTEASPEAPAAVAPKPTRGALAWVSSTYFAEGFPYAVVNNLAEVLFRELGASLATVGLTSLFHVPWNLKFLWAPALDAYETKRRWIVGLEVVLTAALVAVALTAAPGALGTVATILVAVAFLSATHDIAIDGFYLEGLDSAGQSRFVGLRVMAYRVAVLAVGGPVLIVASRVGWRAALLLLAVPMLLLTAFHAWLLPHVEQRRRTIADMLRALLRPWALFAAAVVVLAIVWGARVGAVFSRGLGLGGNLALGALLAVLLLATLGRPLISRFAAARDRSRYAAAFVDFVAQPRIGWALAFVLLFRAGESMLMKMKWPFFHDAMGMELDAYAFANGTVGLAASIGATMLGGWLVSRRGLGRCIWPFTLMQNVLHLLYAGLAIGLAGPRPHFFVLSTVIVIERIGEGVGTAALAVYLMRCCHVAHKAAHFAIVSSLMSVGFTVAGATSGYVAEALGYPMYFTLSFVITVPSMLLILFVPHLDDRK